MTNRITLNEILSDNKISLDAKGLYCIIQSCGQDKLNKDIVATKVQDKKVFEAAWAELTQAGYIM